MIGIYCIRHKETGKCYVGQSVHLGKRLSAHRTRKPNGCHAIYNAIQKYGIDDFAFEILELCEKRNLNQREIHWIATLNTLVPNGYNLRTGGGQGHSLSIEARKRISEAKKGTPSPMKGKKTGRPAWNKGKFHSPETRLKISEVQKGKKKAPFSAEHRRNISKAQKGKTISPEQRRRHSEKMKGKPSPMKGKRQTPEARRKMSESHKGQVPGNKGKKNPELSARNKQPEMRRKASESKKGTKNPNYGKSPSAETRAKISASLKNTLSTKKSSPAQLRLFD